MLHEELTGKVLKACFDVDLNAVQVEVGLLVNFGSNRLEYRRLHK